MKRLVVFLYTQILGNKIYDEFNDNIGELRDMYVTTDEGLSLIHIYMCIRDRVKSLLYRI